MRAYEQSRWTGQGAGDYQRQMVQADPEKLAAALRENLRKRKAQSRAPQPTYGTDEEGDFPPTQDSEKQPDKGSSE
jgi:hypothetical protein